MTLQYVCMCWSFRNLLRIVANQTQMDWIKDVSESDFWEKAIDDQSFSQTNGNFTGALR